MQSDSSKFYTPKTPFSANETVVAEDLYKVGCYIFTVDGPRVTVKYLRRGRHHAERRLGRREPARLPKRPP